MLTQVRIIILVPCIITARHWANKVLFLSARCYSTSGEVILLDLSSVKKLSATGWGTCITVVLLVVTNSAALTLTSRGHSPVTHAGNDCT